MEHNPLLTLQALGQSIWLDFLGRGMIRSGGLQQLIDGDGLSGVTSNPTIFEKAIGGSRDYDDRLQVLSKAGESPAQIYEALTVEDIQMAADVFRPVYDRLEGRDGFVSLEVSPHLAHDTAATIAEARRLWGAVARPNVFIKVPATAEGLPAIQGLIAQGINVNITLLFGLNRYRQVTEAYLAGLEERAAQHKPVDNVASVASFFISRIDTLVDQLLAPALTAGGEAGQRARALQGQAAIASAKMAYQIYRQVFYGERFSRLAASGARRQRLLWASTSTKNPAYSDTKYVEPLVGMDTINTMTLETLVAYRDHGEPALRLTEKMTEAQAALELLAHAGVNLEKVTRDLEEEGVTKFVKSYDNLLAALAQKHETLYQKAGVPAGK